MKKIYLILLVVVLIGGLEAVAFFVIKKKKDSKKSNPKAPVITTEEKGAIAPPKPVIPPSTPEKPFVRQSLEMDIKIPHVDVANRSFDYFMHYKGIQYKGEFQDGITNMVHVKKGFGSFVVSQRKDQERVKHTDQIISVKGSALPDMVEDKTGFVSTKAGAQKVRAGSATGKRVPAYEERQRPIGLEKGISGIASLNSDWVDLFIADTQDRVLKQLSVNLRTGETTDSNIQF